MRRIGLALGGGAARGMAHIGVLQALEELAIPVDCLAGTSSGSIIGALFAKGYSSERLVEVAQTTNWRDLSHLLVPRRSLLGNERMEELLLELLDSHDFADLPLPFAAVCTDLHAGQRVVLSHGSVARAVRASCAIPGIFEPVRWGEQLLVDGGLVENVPAQTVRELGADRVISVDLYADRSTSPQIEGIMGVIMRSFEIMQRQLSGSAEALSDVSIVPQMSGESLLDLARADDYIRLGYQAAMARREQLLRLLE